MKVTRKVPKFLTSKPALLVTVLLVLHATVLYSSIRTEFVPVSRPLAEFPHDTGSWKQVQEFPVEAEVQEILKADDILNRAYAHDKSLAYLFVAAFRSQRTGKIPHSPKNCLPGSGWVPVSSGEISVDIGHQAPITVNRYIVSHGNERDLVLYWYQSRDRVVADEFKAKFWVMVDAMRLNRTDTALVRVIVPMTSANDEQAEKTATDFVRSFYDTLLQYLPS
jgi:EpsI family protein